MRSKSPRSRHPAEDPKQISQRATPGILDPRPLCPASDQPLPSVQVKTPTGHPFLYRKRIASIGAGAKPGDLVEVRHSEGQLLGYGILNPRAEIVVRMLHLGEERPDEAFWQARLERAVELRRGLLALDSFTDAYRVVHAEGDGLSGLIVDRFGDVLSAEIFGLGMYQRAQELMRRLQNLCGTRHTLIRVGPQVHGQEGFLADPISSPGLPPHVTISEFGTKFRVGFEGGHKTGYFCDQRDNRRRLAEFCAGKSVLDLCCYTGGFAIQVKRLGNAADVTGVELDEEPLRLARENAKLNRVSVQFVRADVFGYMRDMLNNGRQYDVVVLDPPKLIRARKEIDEGTRKYLDLNRLAMKLVRPGGLLLSCSCSGLLPEAELLRIVSTAARQAGPTAPQVESTSLAQRVPGRTLQILAKSGAAPDHPVAANCPETEYLKAVWMRVE